MKYINVRQLTRNLREATAELPVRVTQNGLPIFDIVPVDGEKNFEKKISIMGAAVESAPAPQKEFIKCSHLGCMEEATATGKQWSGSEMDLVDVPMCQKHAVQSLREALK